MRFLNKPPALLLSVVVFTLCCTGLVSAQTQPTAEQMRIINQLPPAQRQQALQALRQLQSDSDGTTQSSSISEELTPMPSGKQPSPSASESEERELTAASGSKVIVNLTPKDMLSPAELVELNEDPVLSRIIGNHHYELNEYGVLELPGFEGIVLLGLNDTAISQRLGAEPGLRDFDVSATLLNTALIGSAALKPFGYDIFESDDGGFQPVTAGPVPPDYILGPGDSVRVQLFGNVNNIYEFEVSRNGVLNLPEIGPVTVAGLPFSEFRQDLDNRVREMLIGTQVSVSMGSLRTMRIFISGDVNRPGSYVVSSLATISSALYRSGGISDIGTLRNIELKRKGKIVATLDLYDLLLKGDTSGDVRLQPTDVIFVPPIGDTVGVAGAVRRPAIYELMDESSISDVLTLVGGLQSYAYTNGLRLERINNHRERVVLSIDLDPDGDSEFVVNDGDILFVPEVLPELNDMVTLAGFAQRPGPYQWRLGMRLTDLIHSPLELRTGADSNYILVRRVDASDRSISVISTDLIAAVADHSSPANIALEARDTVHVFSRALGRQRIIEPILEELELQSKRGEPFEKISVAGEVRAPGSYPLEPGMRISDLILAGGDLSEQAFAFDAELTRFSTVGGEFRAKEVISIDLGAILNGDKQQNLLLAPHDHLRINLMPNWNSDWAVSLEGEVLFPGEYQILRGETLVDLLERAGGVTEQAFPEGAIFLRDSLRDREREQLDQLAMRLEADLATMSLESIDTTGGEALEIGQSLLKQLRNTEPVGRLVIDLDQLMVDSNQRKFVSDIQLQDGDRLLVPTVSQEVTVIGEVQHPTSHVYQSGLQRNAYISLSGGLTRKADKRLIYVVRANGGVISSNSSRWFGRGENFEIRPGDTIVVPLETDRIRPLTFWTNVTQILYQGAIAVAAVNSF